MSDSDRHRLAAAYDAQRARVTAAFWRHGHGPAHSQELRTLAACARMLHDAERDAGVPIGTTRAAA